MDKLASNFINLHVFGLKRHETNTIIYNLLFNQKIKSLMKSHFSVSRNALMALVACVALLFAGGSAFAQSLSKGKVLDSKGEPIIGASVVVPGTTNGVITNIDGDFEIRVAPGTTLEVSCIGYVTTRVAAAASMSVTL